MQRTRVPVQGWCGQVAAGMKAPNGESKKAVQQVVTFTVASFRNTVSTQ